MRRVIVRIVLGLWVATALVATQDRIRLWGNELALWADAAQQAPAKPRPWVNLGRQYALDGAELLAANAYHRGITAAEQPSRSRDEAIFGRGIATANLALLRCEAGDLEGALALTEAALAGTAQPKVEVLRRVHVWLNQQRVIGGCPSRLSF